MRLLLEDLGTLLRRLSLFTLLGLAFASLFLVSLLVILELPLELVPDSLQFFSCFFDSLFSSVLALKPLFLRSARDFVFVLYKVFTSFHLTHCLFEFALVFKLTLDVIYDLFEVGFDFVKDGLYKLVLDCERVQHLVKFSIQFFEVFAFFFVAKGDSDSVLTCSSCSANSVHVPFWLSWEAEVDDCLHI